MLSETLLICFELLCPESLAFLSAESLLRILASTLGYRCVMRSTGKRYPTYDSIFLFVHTYSDCDMLL